MPKGPKEPEKIEAATQQYIPIKAVREGVVLMSDHSLKAIVMVSSMNFGLKSEQEKDAIISSYQGFLNALDFPIQILAVSRKLDLEGYLSSVQKSSGEQKNPFLKLQTDEYVNFVNQLLEFSNIMEKRFFVIVPYYPGNTEVVPGASSLFKKKNTEYIGGSFEDNRNRLNERVQIIIEGLSSMGLHCAALGTEDLLELLYSMYNPDTSKNQKVNELSSIDVPIVEAKTQEGK